MKTFQVEKKHEKKKKKNMPSCMPAIIRGN